MEKKYYSTKDVQNILSISRTAANKIMHMFERSGKMFRYGNIMRVEAKVFNEWVKANTQPTYKRKSGGKHEAIA